MVKYENECVGCPSDMGCLGNSCIYKSVKRLYCDKCGNEIDADEEYFGFTAEDMYCENCFIEELTTMFTDMTTIEKAELFLNNGETIYHKGGMY